MRLDFKEMKTHGNRRHGMSHSAEHNTWMNIRARCNNPKNYDYHRYGAIGIRVCDRWSVFENFLEDMGLRPSSLHSIERVNNEGNYDPKNCKWALPVEQANNRSTSRLISFNGETKTAAQWARSAGLKIGTFHYRIQHGWPIERALSPIPRQAEIVP